jgi:hypothetical protein
MYCLLGNDVSSDLELFECFQNNNDNTVINSLSKYCYTNGSKEIMKTFLKKPIYDINTLQNRQKFIQSLNIPNNILDSLKDNENYIDWFFNEKTDDIIDIMEVVYFKFYVFKKLGFNDSSIALNSFNIYNIILSPIIGIISPLTYFIIPYLILRLKFNFKLPFRQFIYFVYKIFINSNLFGMSNIQYLSMGLSLFIYFQGLFNTYEVAKNSFKVCRFLHKKINGLINYIKSGYELFNCTNVPFQKIYNINISFYNIGDKLIMYKKLNKNELSLFVEKVNEILCYNAISKLGLSFCEYIENDSTTIMMDNLWHICIKEPIKNSISLKNNNCLITGPNAGGKSTFIKAFAINIILAQTFGVSCADKCVLTPLYFINTQINIPDLKGEESLFQAEMNRCKYNLDIIQQIPSNKHSLILMDELFNSTNIVEGISGSYAILNKINSYKNCICIVTTHFLYLTTLPKFKKYKMNAIENNNNIIFPYKLKKGISKQYIALELLRNNFDNSIIDKAIEIKNKLVR